MSYLLKSKRPAVNKAGAAAGCVVRGFGVNNQGIRLRILQTQTSGTDGPLKGGFAIIDVGDNKHSRALEPLLHQMTDAAEVLSIIRQEYAGCVSVVNTNILVPEDPS
jgi:hypothetical protein